MKLLELKYEKKMAEVLLKVKYCDNCQRKSKTTSSALFSEFWLRVLTNHKIMKDFVTEEDRTILKYLVDVRTEKLSDAFVKCLNKISHSN
jgi:hypothetical protein